MNRTTRLTLALILSLTMVVTMACGVLNTLTGGGSGTAANLWSDVPPLDGATKAKLDLPLAARLVVQAVFQGKLEFISYTTGKTIQDVQAFYTPERMKQSGWTTDSGGCTSGSSTDTSQGSFCFFAKKEESKETGLVIVSAQDEKTKQTQIFYVRIDLTSTPTPKP